MNVLEPCCLNKQLSKILLDLLVPDPDSEDTTVTFSNGDWSPSKLITFMSDYAAGAEMCLCIPKLTPETIMSIRKVLCRTYRKTTDSVPSPRITSLLLIASPDADMRKEVKEVLGDIPSVTYAENCVASTIMTLSDDHISLTFAGVIPPTSVTHRDCLHHVTACTDPADLARTVKVLKAKARRHTICLND